MDPAEVFVIVFWGILLGSRMLDLLSFWPKTGAWSNCALWELWFNSTFGLFLGRLAAAETREALHD